MLGVYLRKSSNQQEFRTQEPDLRQWLGAQKDRGRFYRDTFTGKEMSRPGFDALLNDVRAGKIGTIVVWRLDRLGRTAKGLLDLLDELLRLNIGFVSLKENIDIKTPVGRLMYTIVASFAAYETEVRRERQIAGIAAAKASGKTWGGRRPGQRIRLTLEKETAARRLRAAGMSVAQIARQLTLNRRTVYRALEPEISSQ